jgi:hypothetical protein
VKYKTINIKEDDYNCIKEYCNKNALKISEWVVLKLKEVINDDTKTKK